MHSITPVDGRISVGCRVGFERDEGAEGDLLALHRERWGRDERAKDKDKSQGAPGGGEVAGRGALLWQRKWRGASRR